MLARAVTLLRRPLVARALSSTPTPGRAFKTEPILNLKPETENMYNYIFRSDHTAAGMALYHKLNFALIGLGPIALVVSQAGPSLSTLMMPLDIVLGLTIPLHSHIGGNDVITDYAKKVTKAKWFDSGLRRFNLFMTVTMLLGLARLNLQGPGVTESIVSLWRPKSSAVAADAAGK
jgi:succinate dehydrogenase (ubiquinone) membrane anchor subunit